MSEVTEQLRALGYFDCFYHERQLWGFHNHHAVPIPIPAEVLQSVGLDTPRQRLMSQAQFWCDRRGIPVRQRRPFSE